MRQKIIICPNDIKLKLLKDNNTINNIKYMTKKEFINNYYFKYNDETIYYLMNKYNLNIDVAKVYLNNLYVIDINKEYKNNKLNYLKELKQELINNNLLVFNNIFKDYIKNKDIEVKEYYDLDLYEEELFNYKLEVPSSNINKPIYKFNTIEEEVNYICIRIIELINSGIDINKIYLTNVTEEYFYIINKLFNYYNIPINIDYNDSIYSTKVVQDFLNNNYELDLDNEEKTPINKKLINILKDLSNLDNSTDTYRKILINKIKNTKLDTITYKNAVNIKDIKSYIFNEDDYVFLLSFNLDILPKMEKDIFYINDSIKDEVNMYKTNYINKREKDIIKYLISRINNLTITYKNKTPFNSYYPSILIKELNLEVIEPDIDKYNYSNIYNEIRLGEKLDNYYTYGEKDKFLEELNTHYKIPYKTYDNSFTNISSFTMDKLRLSYTGLNTYNECKFKYYIKNILKLDNYIDTFQQYIGSLYHKILSLYRNNDFDFEKEFNNYLNNRCLTIKEKVLLVKIKKDLLELIEVLNKQQLLTGYDNTLYEQEIVINDDKTTFIGYIDKIMYYKKKEDTYFSIIDYKTGYIDTNIELMKYGLHMQLPIYLYLIKKSNILENPVFTGIYYQNILFNYPTWSKTLEKDINTRYLLNGYSTDDIDRLSIFDSTYENSNLIKSMKYTDKGFSTYSKTLADDLVNRMVDYTNNEIIKVKKGIINGDFKINPKYYEGKNISCEFCTYKDLCFTTPKDINYLKKVDDLSFLGGDL